MLAGDLPLDMVDRRELCRVEFRRLLLRSRVELRLLPNGVLIPPDHELQRSSGDAKDCVGDGTQNGESIVLLESSGGVRASSVSGDIVDCEVRDVGRSISEFMVEPYSARVKG
jgi:hypothetical protein